MIIYVDIDETICVTPPNRDYTKSTPIKKNIKKINDLYDEGHTIIYWTARGGNTGVDHSELTKKQLDEWGVKRTELRMGKPPYDYWIDDRAYNVDDFFMVDTRTGETKSMTL